MATGAASAGASRDDEPGVERWQAAQAASAARPSAAACQVLTIRDATAQRGGSRKSGESWLVPAQAAGRAALARPVAQHEKLVDTSSALPTDSAIFCLMQGTCGERMPRQGVDPLDLALVETWLKCKSPRGTTD
jgi:hypothetical protein